MKKVLLSLTLFMASFFFISLNKVNAGTYNLNLSDNDFNLINEEFFEFREKVISYMSETSFKSYLIYQYSYDTTKQYRVIFSTSDMPSTTFSYNSGNKMFRISFVAAGKHFNYVNGEFVNNTSLSNIAFNLFSYSSIDYKYIDSNFDIKYTLEHTFNLSYNDSIYTLENGSTIHSLYSIYLDNFVPVDPFEEDKEILNNFYTTIFTKISNLAISFANNYTFLLIFGIFILIFVFELIWRRFI